MPSNNPSVRMWSIVEGDFAEFTVSIDGQDVVATYNDEQVKFPGGCTKDELLEAVDRYNDANKGTKALSDKALKEQAQHAAANQKLLQDLL